MSIPLDAVGAGKAGPHLPASAARPKARAGELFLTQNSSASH
jgi:hypothetical protein